MDRTAIVAVAVLLSAVVGANDGGALLATGLKLSGLRLRYQLVLLVGAVAVVPVLLGTAVARTFGQRLAVQGAHGGAAALVGLTAAIGVALFLTARGRPSSLTLAVVGALTGARIGLGEPVHPGSLLPLLALAATAPFAGAALAFVVRTRLRATARLRSGHPYAFALLCVAYALNDGQKMLAAFAMGGCGYGAAANAVVAVVFAGGLLVGLPKASRSFGESLVPVQPATALSAELAAAAAVLGSAALGAPVSMTQSLSGGLVGAELALGGRKIRWNSVTRILSAWALTLPSSMALGTIGTLALRWL
ncbi:inorganic phosphate transporter [Kitasatospora sp. NPDC089509]|uniref:inorganic phosphate transporter n=1 Tax=Kitasatospora sp. NPDC089509 TaxID=3364079 RepID=UPI0038271E9F